MDRSAFMARILAALGHTRKQTPEAPAPSVDESIARLASAEDDLIGLFARRAESVGMQVHRLAAANLISKVVALLDQLGAKRVVINVNRCPPGISDHELIAAVGRGGIEVVQWQEAPDLDSQFDLDAGITDVHGALAETGTLICNTDSCHSRGASLIPPAHLAIVRASDILPDMIDYWHQLEGIRPIDLPSSQSLITGPSKSSDIEGVLTTGVHGPGIVHILLVEAA